MDSEMDNVPHFAFFAAGCKEMGFMCWRLLRMCGGTPTLYAIRRVIRSLPRRPGDLISESWQEGFCARLLCKASETYAGSDCINYFLYRVPNLPMDAIEMMQAAFEGVLDIAMDLDVQSEPSPPPPPPPPPQPERKRGLIERWAARKGW